MAKGHLGLETCNQKKKKEKNYKNENEDCITFGSLFGLFLASATSLAITLTTITATVSFNKYLLPQKGIFSKTCLEILSEKRHHPPDSTNVGNAQKNASDWNKAQRLYVQVIFIHALSVQGVHIYCLISYPFDMFLINSIKQEGLHNYSEFVSFSILLPHKSMLAPFLIMCAAKHSCRRPPKKGLLEIDGRLLYLYK